MPKGHKLCSNGHPNGPRSFFCTTCNAPFQFKDKSIVPKSPAEKKNKQPKRSVEDFLAIQLKKEERLNKEKGLPVEDWRTLKKGDVILCHSQTYYEPNARIKLNMGYDDCKVKVISLDKDGIFGYNLSEGGASYVYMGDSKYNESTNIYHEPHIVRLLTGDDLIVHRKKKRKKK